MFTIITENDESAWKDEKGIRYHFPKRYRKLLKPGTRVIYYKGSMKKSKYLDERLSDKPHYFAIAKIGDIEIDRESKKGDYFATIVDYQPFNEPILAKQNDEYLEVIPESRITNYWRDGVRRIDETIYNSILSQVHLNKANLAEINLNKNKALTSSDSIDDSLKSTRKEGGKIVYFGTKYERDATNRKRAIDIHGVTCKACGFNFEDFYGAYAKDYIQIHHITPLSELDGATHINPKTDLIPVCANCHVTIHRKKDHTLSIDELKELIKKQSNI
ncbi:HNH endonuclease [Psychrobacter ciconiae]|uniref:HNH endonuclease n=1 Tax=Psychrobacter ciconiae TaxID=1553449 RepID=UPI00191A32C9|nr:HNH endonuclease [Psychrobacter ciconiae]